MKHVTKKTETETLRQRIEEIIEERRLLADALERLSKRLEALTALEAEAPNFLKDAAA